jgi:hypothetical protein
VILSCPGGKVLLAGGVMQRDGPLLDMVVSSFAPMGVTSWVTHVQNRSTSGAMSQVGAVFSAVCARHQ